MADHVGSTTSLLQFATRSHHDQFIVVTEPGILHQMRLVNPGKEFIPAPPEDVDHVYNECSYMKLSTLEKVYRCLENESPEIFVDEAVRVKAVKPIKRMLEISAKHGL
jgi:quinolinate synthase